MTRITKTRKHQDNERENYPKAEGEPLKARVSPRAVMLPVRPHQHSGICRVCRGTGMLDATSFASKAECDLCFGVGALA